MRKQTTVIAVCAVSAALVIGYCTCKVIAQCQQPNPSTANCHSADDWITQCAGSSYANCAVHVNGAIYIYVVEQLHLNAVPSSTGVTETESKKCWKRQACRWNYTEGVCEESGEWSDWYRQFETVVKPNVECPQ
ncbi:MAG: hypothetical protein LBT46_15640 [Planctomycetaceae bacterium]|jgi:hypothetical protein|nr:hypothetical protein [Planctomycetaceae bacterium]